jgi:hypothetical protein
MTLAEGLFYYRMLVKIVPCSGACWTVSRFLSPEGRRPFVLRQALLPSSSDLPESLTERAAPPLLFGLAPHGVCPAGTDYSARGALLPHLFTLTRKRRRKAKIPGGIFSVALSVEPALSRSPRPLAGMLPYGDRTFLPANKLKARQPSDRPSSRPITIVSKNHVTVTMNCGSMD